MSNHYNSISLTQLVKGCQYPASPLVQEAILLGFIVRSVEPHCEVSLTPPTSVCSSAVDEKVSIYSQLSQGCQAGVGKLIPFPAGHRFFHDCYREQEARFLDYMITRYEGNGWFASFTFVNYTFDDKAIRRLVRWYGRLIQAYREVSSAALLKSVTCVEWQQRGVIHYHSLLFGEGLGSLSRKRWECRWQNVGGGSCRIYEADRKAALYLVKHEIKDKPETALNLGGAWRDINPPKSLSECCRGTMKGIRAEGGSPLSREPSWEDALLVSRS